ncbi:MAG: hypothetical protein KGN84_22750 [Acidobacteriota bacterium]|nr:hypothetical protein [Acidobacteriota bacterium]
MSSISLPRPAERVAIVSFLLVYLCGGLVGVAAASYWNHSSHSLRAAKDNVMSVDEWKQQLQLTDDQTAKLTSILDDFSHYYDNVLSDLNSRVLLILNDQQKQRYREMIARHRTNGR